MCMKKMEEGRDGSSRLRADASSSEMDEMAFSFSASGWLMMYQLGVAYSLQRHGVGKANARFAGASGGAAVSAALALDVDARLLADFMTRCCADYHSAPLRNMWRMRQYAESCVRRCMHESTHLEEGLTSGRLNVQVTLLPSVRGVLINKFHSSEYYVKCVMASCTMSPVAGMPFRLDSPDKALDGAYVFDGGMTAIIPSLGPNTITCCPMYFMDADIKPSRFVPLHWAVFPPPVNEFRELFWLGARDGMAWMHERGIGSFSMHPNDLVVRLKTEPFRKAVNPTWRIKPLQPRLAVTSHCSNDPTVSVVNPHALSLVEGHKLRGGSLASLGSDASFSSSQVGRVIAHDEALAGEPLSWRQENMSRIGDSVVVAAAVTCAKPLALGIVYTELWGRAALTAAAAALGSVEKRRREGKPDTSGGWLSMRRWVHEEMVVAASQSWDSASAYMNVAADPSAWLQHVPVVGNKLVDEGSKHKFQQHSTAYRLLERAAVI